VLSQLEVGNSYATALGDAYTLKCCMLQQQQCSAPTAIINSNIGGCVACHSQLGLHCPVTLYRRLGSHRACMVPIAV
jgi:hypothetical protein